MSNIKDKIQAQAAELRTAIELAGFSKLAIDQHRKKAAELVGDFEALLDYIEENKKISDTVCNINLLESLEKTLKADLVKVDSKYLVCDQKRLVSPAGFHPSDRVFVQPTIAIHVDDLAGFKVPAGTQLYAHDIDAIAAE